MGRREYDAETIATFYRNLATTRIKRIARIVTSESKREHMILQVLSTAALPMQKQKFTEETSAWIWLTESRLPHK